MLLQDRQAGSADPWRTTTGPDDRFLPTRDSRLRTQNSGLLPNERVNPLFNATAQAVEEAIINALVAAETMTGINGNTVYALPHDRLREVLRRYNRL